VGNKTESTNIAPRVSECPLINEDLKIYYQNIQELRNKDEKLEYISRNMKQNRSMPILLLKLTLKEKHNDTYQKDIHDTLWAKPTTYLGSQRRCHYFHFPELEQAWERTDNNKVKYGQIGASTAIYIWKLN